MNLRSIFVLVGAFVMWPLAAIANPVRIQIKLDSPSVVVGASLQVTAVFLDREFRPVANDRLRAIRLELLSTGDNTSGRAAIAPPHAKVAAGATSHTARLTASGAGTVLIRATSDGLAPGEAVVKIRGAAASLWTSILPVVHAQGSTTRQLLPSRHEPVPLNHVSIGQFSIIPSSPKPPGARLRFRIDTDPAVLIRYGDTEQMGSTIVPLAGGDQSGPIYVHSPLVPGRIRVSAQELPDGAVETAELEFVPPHPVSIGFDRESYTAKSDHRIVTVNVGLRDKDLIPLEVLAAPYDVRFASDAGSSWGFEPSTVRLTATSAAGTSKLHVPWFRFGRDLQIVAEADALRPAQVSLKVMATEVALIALALLGGFCGGLARHVYVVRSPRILPSRMTDRLEPGLVGNALFSALSGLVLFKGIDLGIVHLVAGGDAAHESAALGFVLGVVGGYAGVLVFETIAKRVVRANVPFEVAGG